MKIKIVGIFILGLLIATSILLMPRDTNVKAETGNEEENFEYYLNYQYMWDVIDELTNVIHNVSIYPPNDIKKGRSFGSEGDRWTSNYLWKEFKNSSSFDNARRVQLEHLEDFNTFYSEFVEVTSYDLWINHSQYSYDNHPLPEDYFPEVAVRPECGGSMTFDRKYEDTSVINFDNFSINFPKWTTGINEKNISFDELNDIYNITGNLTYLGPEDEVPEYQRFGTVFLLEEVESVEDQIENVTNASGIILIDDSSIGYSFENASKYDIPIVKISEDGDDAQNLTTVKQYLENGTLVIVDNMIFEDKLTFIHDMSSPLCWPDEPFVILYNLSDDPFNDSKGKMIMNLQFIWLRNGIHPLKKCLGFIFYNILPNEDCHTQVSQNIDNIRMGTLYPVFALPGFSVNQTIGQFLWDHTGDFDNTISGHINQVYHEEEDDGHGVVSYNVEAYLNISKSPGDAIVCISSRMDAMWNECPGDSGAGNGIIMGIAEYMSRLNQSGIKPKYNITFVMTTNEENGMYGAQFFSDSHPYPKYNITLWIGTDQLGFNIGSLFNVYKNDTHRDIGEAIAELLDYEGKTGYGMDHNTIDDFLWYYTRSVLLGRGGVGAEDVVYYERGNCDTILIHKNHDWKLHHARGLGLTVGDVIDDEFFDKDDVSVFYNFTWDTVKYFCYNPNCWFSDVTFEPIDSPNDGDTLDDSILANFTINSVLPHDKVRVVANITQYIGEESINYSLYKDYIITPSSSEKSWAIQIPDIISHGNCSVQLNIFNSTGRIDYAATLDGTANYNDTSDESDIYHLYHPFGYTKAGSLYQTTNNYILGSTFFANEYGVADNITAFINIAYGPPGNYKCMIYRVNDSKLIGTTVEDYNILPGNPGISSWWTEFNFTDPKPIIEKDTEYVLTCWGSNSYCRLHGDDFSWSRGRYDWEPYGYPPEYASFTSIDRIFSIYCSYTADKKPPEINNVTDNPDIVGFGLDVNITAEIDDSESGIWTVKINITYPNDTYENFTMESTKKKNEYFYKFNDTWKTGQYNYTIWAKDNSENNNLSKQYSFNVSANATINIATLQDTYGDGEYINITDPPNLPENYYLTNRGLTYNKYYNAETGNDILEVYTQPVNYQDENMNWMPINTTFERITPDQPAYSYGYRAGNNKGLYSTYFKPNIQENWPVTYAYSKSNNPTTNVIRTKLVGVGYLDPSNNYDYEYLQNIQSSQGRIEDCSILYEDVFTGTDVKYIYGASGLKEEIIMDTAAESILSNNPPSDFGLSNSESYLVFITRLDFQDLVMYNEYGEISDETTITENGVDFKDIITDEFKCSLPLGVAYEQNNPDESKKLMYRIIRYNSEYYLLSGLKVVDLQEMSFPVVIDPTLSTESSTSDGHIYKSSSSYSTAQGSSTGTVQDSYTYLRIGQQRGSRAPYTYQVYRGFVFFNTSSIPSNVVITNATLSLYKNSDSSTTDFDVVVQNGQPTYPHDPLVSGDYNKDHYSGDGGSFNTADFTNGYNDIYLNNYSWIYDEGWTKLCLRSSRDINSNTPTGSEDIRVYSAEYGLVNHGPKLVVEYRNQSKIKNIGNTNISGYLLIQVQYSESGGEEGDWIVDNDTINETTPRTINLSEQLALDLIFNGLVSTDDLTHGDGTYRVYAAFRNPDGDVLVCDDESVLEAWYEFEVATS